MVKSPKLSDVTDRANCSTEMMEKTKSRGQSKLLCKESQGRGGGGGGAGVEAVGKRNDGRREEYNVSSNGLGQTPPAGE